MPERDNNEKAFKNVLVRAGGRGWAAHTMGYFAPVRLAGLSLNGTERVWGKVSGESKYWGQACVNALI